MRHITVTLAILLASICISQTANEKVINYVDSKVGKKVKTGICFDLVDKALCQVDGKWKKRSDRRYVYGKQVPIEDVLPGDIMKFNGVKLYQRNGTEVFAASHVAVVYKVLGDNMYVTADQNAEGKSLKKSRVVFRNLDLGGEVTGKIKVYRPY